MKGFMIEAFLNGLWTTVKNSSHTVDYIVKTVTGTMEEYPI